MHFIMFGNLASKKKANLKIEKLLSFFIHLLYPHLKFIKMKYIHQKQQSEPETGTRKISNMQNSAVSSEKLEWFKLEMRLI